jgi:hypothetical protein
MEVVEVAELEPGHPHELVRALRNWLRAAHEPLGSLPAGTDQVEWAVRQFIASWAKPVRSSIQVLEECLKASVDALEAGDTNAARREIEAAQQLVGESLRDELGLYVWDES